LSIHLRWARKFRLRADVFGQELMSLYLYTSDICKVLTRK